VSIEIEFSDIETADEDREQHQEYVCLVDDACQKTVAFVSGVPEWLLYRTQVGVSSSRNERITEVIIAGDAPLIQNTNRGLTETGRTITDLQEQHQDIQTLNN